MSEETRPQVSVSPKLLPGSFAAHAPTTYRGRAVLVTLAKGEPEKALRIARDLRGDDGATMTLRAGDMALMQNLPDLAKKAYALALRRFRYTQALGKACARYGLALVAYSLRDHWQALREIDAALEGLAEWRTLQDNGLGHVLAALGDDILTRAHF